MIKSLLFLPFFSLSFFSAAQVIVRGPYMQSNTDVSIQIMWRTSSATDSKVWYGSDSTNLSQTVTAGGSNTNHDVLISGLQPHTLYYYAVGNAAGQMTIPGAQFSFRTHPVSGDPVDTRVWCIGDFGRGNQGQIDVLSSYENYTGGRGTDVWLWLGDNAYDDGSDNEYQTKLYNHPGFSHFFNYTPYYPSPGNHDYGEVWAESTFLGIPYTNIALSDHEGPYYDMVEVPQFGEAGGFPSQLEVFYSFDYGDVHFLSLNSEVFDYTFTYDGINQMNAWITNDLQNNDKKFTIAYFHQPPYSKGSHDSDDAYELVMKAMREHVIPVLESFDVDLIVCGHSHVFERSMMIKGHTGNSGDFNASHVMDGSNGNFAAGNAYVKDGDNATAEGTVYVVCGNSGSSESSPTLDYPCMVYTHGGSGAMGSFIIDVKKNRLSGKYLKVDGTIDDEFSIVKQDMSLDPISDLEICEGESVNVTALIEGGSDSLVFSWSPSTETGITASLSPTSSTTYSLQVTDLVSGQVETIQFNVIVNTVAAQIITEPLPGTLGVTGCTGCTYQWSINSSAIGGATGQFYQPQFTGDYTCTVTDQNGCTITTAIYSLNTIGFDQLDAEKLAVYPNPAQDAVTVFCPSKFIGHSFAISNMSGQIIYQGTVNDKQTTIEINALPAGNYLINFDDQEGSSITFSKN